MWVGLPEEIDVNMSELQDTSEVSRDTTMGSLKNIWGGKFFLVAC